MNVEERIVYEKEVGLDTDKDCDKLRQININWSDRVFDKSVLLQDYEVQVNGTTDKICYYVSDNFRDQDGVAIESYFKHYSAHANVETQVRKWFKLGANIMMTHEKIQ